MIEFTFLDLPLPPSVNRLWRSGRGRVYRSEGYDAWRKAAGWELVRQKPARLKGWVSITIAAGQPDRRRRDLDNVSSKALLDLLVAHQVIEDDSKVAAISSRWDSLVTPGRLQVEVKPAAAPERRTLTETTTMSKPLTPKQQRFLDAYLQTNSGSEAYRTAYKAAGMSPGSVKVEASRLLRNERIAQRLAQLRQDDAGQAGLPDGTPNAQASPEPPETSPGQAEAPTDAKIIDNPKVDVDPNDEITLTSGDRTGSNKPKRQPKTTPSRKPAPSKTETRSKRSNGMDPNTIEIAKPASDPPSPPKPPKSKPKTERKATAPPKPTTKARKKARRPVRYSEKLAEVICQRLREGKALRAICRGKGMPTETAVRQWAADEKHPFAARYAHARRIGYEKMADEVIGIADGDSGPADSAQVQRDRLKFDARRWVLSKCLPKIYGDRVQVEATASPEMMRLDDDRAKREQARRLVYILDNLMREKAKREAEQRDRERGPKLIEMSKAEVSSVDD